jgi:Family of unknown function (DUF6069)
MSTQFAGLEIHPPRVGLGDGVWEGGFMTSSDRVPPQPVVFDAGRLWTGGIATALVAALTVTVGVLIATGLLDVNVLAPPGFTDSGLINYVIAAAFGALVATALIHFLIVAVPRPFAYFSWIMGLAVLVVTLLPFLSSADTATRVATAAINLVVGIAIASLTSGMATRVVRRRQNAVDPGPPY